MRLIAARAGAPRRLLALLVLLAWPAAPSPSNLLPTPFELSIEQWRASIGAGADGNDTPLLIGGCGNWSRAIRMRQDITCVSGRTNQTVFTLKYTQFTGGPSGWAVPRGAEDTFFTTALGLVHASHDVAHRKLTTVRSAVAASGWWVGEGKEGSLATAELFLFAFLGPFWGHSGSHLGATPSGFECSAAAYAELERRERELLHFDPPRSSSSFLVEQVVPRLHIVVLIEAKEHLRDRSLSSTTFVAAAAATASAAATVKPGDKPAAAKPTQTKVKERVGRLIAEWGDPTPRTQANNRPSRPHGVAIGDRYTDLRWRDSIGDPSVQPARVLVCITTAASMWDTTERMLVRHRVTSGES